MKTIAILLFSLFLTVSTQAASVESEFDQFYCNERGLKDECVLYRASILNLITTPERFHGKRVRVIGHLSMGQEEIALYYMKGASHVEAVWLSITDHTLETEADVDKFWKKEKQVRKQFNNQRILIEGEFDMHANNRFLFRGRIKNITRMQKW